MNARRYRHGLLTLALVLAQPVSPGWGATPDEVFGILSGTVVEGDTGLPASCTVDLVDAAGAKVMERDSFRAGFRCDGRFTKRLPAGQTRLRVTRGFETHAVDQVVEVSAGRTTEVQVRLERIVNLRRLGWYAGDSHDHMIHGEQTIPVDFDFVALTARAEDLQYLSLAQAWVISNATPEKLEAELSRRSTPTCVLTWNLEAPKNYYRGDAGRCLGHCWTLGLRGRTDRDEDVIGLLLQASAHDYESDKPSFANFESHQLIHAQGGSVFYTHPARWWTGPWGGQGGYPKQERMRVSNMAVELPLDTLIGPSFDGVDVITGSGEFQANAMAFELWCLLLNHGYRVAGTASSDACFDRPGGATPGVARTYTYLGEGFSLGAVARATAQGRTFATTGPLLLVSVDGQPPGSAFAVGGQSRKLKVEAWASGADAGGLTRLEILRNGKSVQTNLFKPTVPALKMNVPITERESAWYCVRVFGSDPQRQRAISGAFFFDAEPHRPPAPVPARLRVTLQDATSGGRLSGFVTEVSFHGVLPRNGRRHAITDGEVVLTVPATVRLRAEAAGYRPQTQSPILDQAALVDYITRLQAEDLVKWETFERVRTLLGQGALTFRMEKILR